MADLDKMLRLNQLLTMGIESWDLYRASPGWIRDRFAAVNHYSQPGWEFDIAEILLTEVFSGNNSDYYFLSLMVNGEGAEVQELDNGFGAFLRQPVPGSLVFVDVNISKSNRGRGPYHVLTTRAKGSYVRQRLSDIWQTDASQFLPLLKSTFFEPEIESLMWQLLAAGRGAPSIITGPEIFDLILGYLLHKAGHSVDVKKKLPAPLRRAFLQKALNHIGSHFRSKIRRSDLVSVTGLNEKQLAEAFQSELGMTSQEYMKRFRLTRVREMLLNGTRLTIKEIAQACGFVDERDLYPDFENVFGQRPGDLRP